MVRRLVHALIIVLTLVVGATAGAVIVSQTAWFKDWLRLQTNVLQGSSTQQQLFQRMQGSGVDLLFFFSY